jgi:TrpR-related protein YerC/YecD
MKTPAATTVLPSDAARQFADALTAITDPKAMQNFLRDILSEKEITEISNRLEAARMLQAGMRYVEIIAKTKLSSRTVARISSWMRSGNGGYQIALKAITKHHPHI